MRTLLPVVSCLAALATICLPATADAVTSPADPVHLQVRPNRQAPAPRLWRHRPPDEKLARYRLHDPKTLIGLRTGQPQRGKATASCRDTGEIARHAGDDLANYLVGLPAADCTYGLFSLDAAPGARIYGAANLDAVARRFIAEAGRYDGNGLALINLALYLRAGYYLSVGGVLPPFDPAVRTALRPAIRQLLAGKLFAANVNDDATAQEVLLLITNLQDEPYYLDDMKRLIERYTNSPAHPQAAHDVRESTAARGFTGVLTVLFYAHFRAPGALTRDPGYATALNRFVLANQADLRGTESAYQLGDAARENVRFLQYPALRATVAQQTRQLLASSGMTGADDEIWLAAAEGIKYYDNARCAEYGTCDFEARLAALVLGKNHSCSPSVRIRAQQMTMAQMTSACGLMQQEENYFHRMLNTRRQPVADDLNASLEVAVFADYNNYGKYGSVLFGIDTNNGGMYLEGDPARADNQARFVAHEASWLRPLFKVWNLEHEYIHYLDGRFDLYGDFGVGTRQPTVWWIEGLAEYLSQRNGNQAAIDAARSGQYPLSWIFANDYSMPDYVNRAYRWGYMATRFMFERHRPDVDTIVARFRAGRYEDYQNLMRAIGTRYDNEFAAWAQQATTGGEPPLPPDGLPPCPGEAYKRLANRCALFGLGSASVMYATLYVPAGARNLTVWTDEGRGDVDLYLAGGRYPSPADYDLASTAGGSRQSVSLAAPAGGQWFYVTLRARSPFAGVTLAASFD